MSDMSGLRISTDRRELDIDMIHAFLTNEAPWSKGISRETVARSIEGSLCFGAYLGAQQVGFARVVTDYATFGYLCDVFVHRSYRGRGYARALMRAVFDSEVLASLRRIVLVTTDAHEIYRPLGFNNLANPERYMELHRVDVYATAPGRNHSNQDNHDSHDAIV